MNKVVIAFISVVQHFIKNISNYSLFAGLALVLNFVFKKYGIDIVLLSVGVLLIATSFVLEINNINGKKNKRY